MTTFRTCHKFQLKQLKKLDNGAYRVAQVALNNGWESTAVLIIQKAMQTALTRLTQVDPAEAIYTALIEHVKTGQPIPTKGMTLLWRNRDIQAYLRRDDDDRLRVVVYRNCIPRSGYVGFWGNDDSHISSRAGCWKVAKEARKNIEKLVKDGKG